MGAVELGVTVMVVSVEIEHSVTQGYAMTFDVDIDKVNVKLVVTPEASVYMTSIEEELGDK